MFPEVDEDGFCLACGKIREVGDWPDCPHGQKTEHHAEYFPDEIPGGMMIENGVPHPVKVYSHSELRALRAKGGYVVKEKFCPTPGTDIDPAGVANPKGYQDAYTLQAGAALMLRAAKVPEDDVDISKLFIPAEDLTLTHEEMAAMLKEAEGE